MRRVYPRACGGTTIHSRAASRSPGLSPRVRGNPKLNTRRPPGLRSIPARAGEPPPTAPTPTMRRVYPRACGGTTIHSRAASRSPGLSPRVRGNPKLNTRRPPGLRSIPARAGEPPGGPRWPPCPSVYPRACGGTACAPAATARAGGLSPRVRGNRGVHFGQPHDGGSIPARAGEPLAFGGLPARSRVYPRACGGTGIGAQWAVPVLGLSPRVRGNLCHPPIRS